MLFLNYVITKYVVIINIRNYVVSELCINNICGGNFNIQINFEVIYFLSRLDLQIQDKKFHKTIKNNKNYLILNISCFKIMYERNIMKLIHEPNNMKILHERNIKKIMNN